jgi:hypothetical protein
VKYSFWTSITIRARREATVMAQLLCGWTMSAS